MNQSTITKAELLDKAELWTERIYLKAAPAEREKIMIEAKQDAAAVGAQEEFENIVDETVFVNSGLNHLAILAPDSELSEIKAAATFGALYRSKLRYNTTAKSFYYYNGKYWELDEGNVHAQTLAKKFHKLCMMYGYSMLEDNQIDPFIKFYSRYNKKTCRDTLLSDSVTELAISEKDFDKHTHLFNVRNGTIDLNTFKLREHAAEDLLTNYADVDYIPQARSELWDSFISDILPNDFELQRYVGSALGYALTGDPTLERMFIFYGQSTRNGKSTLLNSISNVLGSYSKSAPAEILQLKVKDSRNASEDLARLSKCRFLTVSEPSHSMIFDVPLIKSLTGRDTITARYLHQNSFEYVPKFSLFLNTNYLPRVLDDSLFSSGRVDVIPFTRHFSEQEQDTTLKQKLQTEESKSAILSWLLQGLQDFKKNGLIRPYSVIVATRQYVQQSDKLQSFIDECLEESEKPCLTFKDCYELYKNWCSSCGYASENKGKFKELLNHKNLLLETATINGKTVRNVIKGYRSQ